MVKRNLLNVVAASVQDGIQYEKISGYVYELRELQADGAEARDLFMDQSVRDRSHSPTARPTSTTSRSTPTAPRRRSGSSPRSSTRREDIKFFMKLPDKFKIETPVGRTTRTGRSSKARTARIAST